MRVRHSALDGTGLKWALANVCGFTLGALSHCFIGHGVTGEHDFWLTLPQFIMHTIGFFALAGCVGLAQRSALQSFVMLSYRSVLVKSAAVTAGFWVGYYGGGIPFDIIGGFATLGAISGLELRGKIANWGRWMSASGLGFTFAGVVTIAAALPVYKQLLAAFGGGLWGHVTLWMFIGIVGGTAAGLLTGPSLAKSLHPEAEALAAAPGTF